MPNVPFPKLDIGGRSLILHKIEAKKKELDIVVASILEQLAPIEEYCNVVIFYEVKTAVENFKAGKVKFEDCSKIFSDIDDRLPFLAVFGQKFTPHLGVSWGILRRIQVNIDPCTSV